MEVAEQFPCAQVIGMDLAPVQKKAPLNCKFLVGDLTVDLKQLKDGTIDLVHSRFSSLLK